MKTIPVLEAEVKTIIMSLKPKNSTGIIFWGDSVESNRNYILGSLSRKQKNFSTTKKNN
jgi:hypothetical protein